LEFQVVSFLPVYIVYYRNTKDLFTGHLLPEIKASVTSSTKPFLKPSVWPWCPFRESHLFGLFRSHSGFFFLNNVFCPALSVKAPTQ